MASLHRLWDPILASMYLSALPAEGVPMSITYPTGVLPVCRHSIAVIPAELADVPKWGIIESLELICTTLVSAVLLSLLFFLRNVGNNP